jgi:hypothetical protein
MCSSSPSQRTTTEGEENERYVHPLWRLATAGCAGYLKHLFIKLGMCASIISLVSHLAFTKRGSCQEDREQASSCSLNTHASLSATKQRNDVVSSSVKRKQGKERSNTLSFGTAISRRHMSFIRQGRTRFPRFMLLFGNRDVTPPAQERRLFCSADQVEEHRASTVPESAAESLGVVALD